jgi:hypothetical protein
MSYWDAELASDESINAKIIFKLHGAEENRFVNVFHYSRHMETWKASCLIEGCLRTHLNDN